MPQTVGRGQQFYYRQRRGRRNVRAWSILVSAFRSSLLSCAGEHAWLAISAVFHASCPPFLVAHYHYTQGHETAAHGYPGSVLKAARQKSRMIFAHCDVFTRSASAHAAIIFYNYKSKLSYWNVIRWQHELKRYRADMPIGQPPSLSRSFL